MPRRSPRPTSARAPRAEYHHGDLHRALLRAARRILKDEGLEALTLRGVARAAGVSQTAPYRHFADRAALIAAVAEQVFQELERELIRAAARPDATLGEAPTTARGGLQAIAVAYVRFALARPGEYRLMFGHELALAAPTPPSRQKVFEFLRVGIAMLQQRGLVRAGDPQTMALTCWALVHGLVMLALDGQLAGRGAPSPDDLTTRATELLMFGMAT